jgi:hypothetical protein
MTTREWVMAADETVATSLRKPARPHRCGLSDRAGQLSTRSDEFPRPPGAPHVGIHSPGVKHSCLPVVGDLEPT